MNTFRYLILLGLMLSLSACAVMDLSFQSTAVPVRQGGVEASTYMSVGVDLDDLSRNFDGEDNSSSVSGWFVNGIKVRVPLQEELDLHARIYTAGSTTGAIVGVNKLLQQEDNYYLAISPSVNVLFGNDGDPDTSTNYLSYGMGAYLINSWVLNRYFTPSLGIRGHYNRFSREYDGVTSGPYDIFNAGVMGSMQINLYKFYLLPEIGVELIPIPDKTPVLYPSVSLGAGWKF